MNSLSRLSGCLIAIFSAASLHAVEVPNEAPDSLVLKNGNVVYGLIVKNTRDAVILQTKFEEKTYLKSEIVRIRDEANVGVEYTDIARKGELPPWRIIANDLRTNDAIRSMREIPATLIDNGEFKNVPYKSFRVNESVELNIYGDPEKPAGLELGIYGSKSGNMKLRKIIRAYLAGFLTTREEISALYSINLDGGIKEAGNLVIEITPKDAPDAYGAWWVSLYNKKALADARLDDTEYSKLVKPFDQVVDKKGRVIANGWSDDEMGMSERASGLGSAAMVLLRGFYRDKNGDFRLITDKSVQPAKQ